MGVGGGGGEGRGRGKGEGAGAGASEDVGGVGGGGRGMGGQGGMEAGCRRVWRSGTGSSGSSRTASTPGVRWLWEAETQGALRLRI